MAEYVFYAPTFDNELQVWIYDSIKRAVRCEKKLELKMGNFVVLNHDGTRLYAGSEAFGGDGFVTVFDTTDPVDPKLMMTYMTGDQGPAYVSLSEDNRYLLTASYFSGSLFVYGLDENGCPDRVCYKENLTTYGTAFPKKSAGQAVPRCHCIRQMPGTDLVFASDYSGDRLLCYRLKEDGSMELLTAYQLARGEAARHVEFAPGRTDRVYLNTEFMGNLYVFEVDPDSGRLECLQKVNALEDEVAARCTNLRISKCGNYLYNANRSNENISVFRIDQTSGKLTFINAIPDLGMVRDFNFDPENKVLIVGCQSQEMVRVFEMNWNIGLCAPLNCRIPAKRTTGVIFQKGVYKE